MPHAPIPFISRYDEVTARAWLAHLRRELPDERIVLPNELSADDKAGATFAIVGGAYVEHFAGFTGLEWVQSTWAGVESVVEALPRDVHVVKLTDPELTDRMTEAVLAWTLYLHRRMPDYRAQQSRRYWAQLPYRRADEVTVGVLGLGALGRASALRLRENGYRVCGWSHAPKDIDGVESHVGEGGLGEVLAKADILVCLLSLTEDTRGLLNAAAFAKTKVGSEGVPAAGLINFARGPIVVTTDLLRALDEGRLYHAVLDVHDEEPLPPTAAVWSHPRVTVLPHISAVTEPESAARVVGANVRRWRETGVLPQGVHRERGY